MVTIGTLNGGNITVTLGSSGSTPKWHVQVLTSEDGWDDEDQDGDGNPYINPVYQDYTLEGTYEDSSYEDENVKLRIYKEVKVETRWKIYVWIKSQGEEEEFGYGMEISQEGDEHPTKTHPDDDWTVIGIEWR